MMKGKNSHIKQTIKRLPEDGIGLEIGVWKGESSVLFAEKSKHVDCVDPWSVEVYEDGTKFDMDAFVQRYESIVGSDNPEDFQKFYDNLYVEVKEKLESLGNVTVHRMTSKEFFDKNTKMYDWVYVDGDHSYEGCLYDLQNVWSIIKEGGTLFGDDYGNKDGVTKAVNEFREGKEFDSYGVNQYRIKK
jgi:hypothetical protein